MSNHLHCQRPTTWHRPCLSFTTQNNNGLILGRSIYLCHLKAPLRSIMTKYKTTSERLISLGQNLRDIRLRQNIDQRQLAERSAVALNVIKNLEGGKGTTVTSFIKVLRALDRDAWLDTLAPQVSISPMQILKQKPTRKRASKRAEADHV